MTRHERPHPGEDGGWPREDGARAIEVNGALDRLTRAELSDEAYR